MASIQRYDMDEVYKLTSDGELQAMPGLEIVDRG